MNNVSLTKFIYVSKNSKYSEELKLKINELQKEGYELKQYDKKIDSDLIIRTQVYDVIELYQNYIEKPLICVITSNLFDFDLGFNSLYLQGFDNINIILKSTLESNNEITFVNNVLLWNDMIGSAIPKQKTATLSNVNKEISPETHQNLKPEINDARASIVETRKKLESLNRWRDSPVTVAPVSQTIQTTQSESQKSQSQQQMQQTQQQQQSYREKLVRSKSPTAPLSNVATTPVAGSNKTKSISINPMTPIKTSQSQQQGQPASVIKLITDLQCLSIATHFKLHSMMNYSQLPYKIWMLLHQRRKLINY